MFTYSANSVNILWLQTNGQTDTHHIHNACFEKAFFFRPLLESLPSTVKSISKLPSKFPSISSEHILTNKYKLRSIFLFPQNIFYPISPLWSIQSLFVLIEFRFRIVLLLMYFVWHIYLYAPSKSVLDGVTIKQTSASTSVPAKITR